ncbi:MULTISPECIES: hypothetical protein [Saccharibacter]|nr:MULTISPECIES: hypothetical protein [Saccharibacter]
MSKSPKRDEIIFWLVVIQTLCTVSETAKDVGVWLASWIKSHH